LITATIVLTGTFVGVFSFSNYSPSYALTKARSLASCAHTQGYMTIIADDHGYNDSIAHGAPINPWPLISVKRGDTVNLTFCNLDSVEAHGLAIDTYFDRGVILSPGTAYQISFTAYQTGSFRIFCTNFCTVHKYMSGTLVVS
jgi:nitrous oxide reductase